MHRGGQDHTAHEFTLASCFQFSSISIPPLEPQDRRRLGILELRPFPVGAIAPDLAKFKLASPYDLPVGNHCDLLIGPPSIMQPIPKYLDWNGKLRAPRPELPTGA